jgi:hypothetical protein
VTWTNNQQWEDCISQDSFRLKRGRCQLKAESVG